MLAKRHPTRIGTQINLAHTYLLAQERAEATHYYELSAQECLTGPIDGCAVNIYWHLGESLSELRRPELASAAFLRAAQSTTDDAKAAEFRRLAQPVASG